MKKYICLRDDDTSFFTTPDDLLNAYGEFWGKLPITLAIVPFSHGSQRKKVSIPDNLENRDLILRKWQINASADELTEYHKTYPVGGNKELVSFLKPFIKNGMVEIAQHGVFHRYNERGPEMFANEMAFEAIRDGKEYLEKVFETEIKTFVPPSNTVDVTCASYLRRLGFNLFSSGPISKDNSMTPTYDFSYRMHHLYNHILRKRSEPAKWNRGLFCISSVTYNTLTTSEIVYNKVEKQLNEKGFAGLGTHYFTFREDGYTESYHTLINKFLNEGVHFVNAINYCNLILKKYYE